MSEKTKGIFLLLCAAAMMSTGGLFIKSINAGSMTISFTRSLIAGIFFLPFIKWRQIRFSKNYILLISSYIYLTLSYITATKMTTAANAIILQCAAPLWLYLAYLITGKKKITVKELIPRAVILTGILIIFIDPANRSGGSNMIIGNLLALSAGIAYAAEQYLMEKDYPMNDTTLIGIINFCMALFILITMTKQIDYSGVDVKGWLFFIILGVFQIGLSYILFVKGIRKVSAFEASIISLLEPVLNPIWVLLFVGEIPTVYTAAGFGFILFGIIFTLVTGQKEKCTV